MGNNICLFELMLYGLVNSYGHGKLDYDMFSLKKYLIVNLVFPTSVFGVGNSS